MKAEDRIKLTSGKFDRESWAELWDRLPQRARHGAAEIVLQKLHAIESSGHWSLSWYYNTNVERGESGMPAFEFDQPGDTITLKGTLRVGKVNELETSPEYLVGVACLSFFDWHKLRQANPQPPDLGDDHREITRLEDQRFAELVMAGKNPCRVLVPATEFLEWCSIHQRTPDSASRDAYADEKFSLELSRYRDQQGGK